MLQGEKDRAPGTVDQEDEEAVSRGSKLLVLDAQKWSRSDSAAYICMLCALTRPCCQFDGNAGHLKQCR